MVLSVSFNKFISEIMLCKLLSEIWLRIVLVSRNKNLCISNNLSVSNNRFCDALDFFKSKIVFKFKLRCFRNSQISFPMFACSNHVLLSPFLFVKSIDLCCFHSFIEFLQCFIIYFKLRLILRFSSLLIKFLFSD